jgi:hypothetical protein
MSKRDREEEAQFEELKTMGVVGQMGGSGAVVPGPGVADRLPYSTEERDTAVTLDFTSPGVMQQFVTWFTENGWPLFATWLEDGDPDGDGAAGT